jgi:hypothetical protein
MTKSENSFRTTAAIGPLRLTEPRSKRSAPQLQLSGNEVDLTTIG